ncbi:MAG TPA: hypothetical protein VFH03_20985 [Actinoplanes sp.]|nr:hypothetical protein [Actinoplanes sp.]
MDATRRPTGPVSTFAEPDYRFGVGPLIMRVERVDWANPVFSDGENWFEVDGMELAADGREIRRRQALVRGRRLAALRGNAGRNTGPAR